MGFLDDLANAIQDEFFEPRPAKQEGNVYQGCGRVLGHGDYCSEGHYCESCSKHAKRQADALSAGWPTYTKEK